MKKNLFKYIVFISLLTFLCILIIHSYLINLKLKENTNINLAQKQILDSIKKEKLKDYLLGKFNPKNNPDFILVPKKYTTVDSTMYLRKETFKAFIDMHEAAKKDGINLKIASATRNFEYQKILWNNKWNGVTLVDGNKLTLSTPNELERFKKILEYNAVPATSRHHWGTDIDINDANLEYFNTKEGEKVYDWLVTNAPLFGFCQPYNKKNTRDKNNRTNGYNEEKWHWSYLPLARNFTKEYENLITNDYIQGFDGDEYVKNNNLIKNYVLSINPECF